MDEVIYFTNRQLEQGKGSAKAWTYKEKCPKCGKALMGKPKDPKTGKVKMRAKEYVCPDCNHTIEKKAYEESLHCQIKYKCPKCGNESEIKIPFKRKKVQLFDVESQKKKSVDALQFECSKCKEKINITKKMKE